MPHRDHGRAAAFPGQGIHIAWSDRNSHTLFRLPGDPLHVSSQQSVHAGDADHDEGRLFSAGPDDLRDRPGDHIQMTGSHQVGLADLQVEKTVLISFDPGNVGCVSAAAAGRHDQHDGTRDRQTCPFDPEPFRSRRVEGQCRRRIVDQVGRSNVFGRDIVRHPLIQFLYRVALGDFT